jgi:copper resistance protein C
MLKRVILLLLFIFVFVFSNQALAHTSLLESSPKDDEIVTEPIQELSLIYGTKVEQTSKIRVANSEGESITLGNLVVEEDEMWATFLQPLENGNYDVKWTIVGADGHPIEGAFSFSVDVSIDGKMAETEEEDLKKVENNHESSTKQSKPEIKQSNLPSYVIPSITGVLFIIVVGSILWLIRRKR